jgi:hypothetical protein
MIIGIIILIIIGVIVETILIGRILTDLRVIDNMQECDKQFWEDEKCLNYGEEKEQ